MSEEAETKVREIPDREQRSFGAEVRADIQTRRIVGYAAVFNALSEDLGGFRERILPGAFSDTLQDDVRALWNHDPNFVLGRSTSGTLSLVEDEVGLRYHVQAPDTSWANDLLVTMSRGDVDQSSFGFRVLDERWVKEDGVEVREIVKMRELFDVSPVTYPAYPQTKSNVRGIVAGLISPVTEEPVEPVSDPVAEPVFPLSRWVEILTRI